ncbi:hypothetical protein RZS32_003725 [Roseovarius sp. W115]|uniref:Uncharacterized protein n=1 Tax=Roseovarius rhodophyticola TaxID=3080827 RepID=A0ABZ2TMH0_9RHOB
MAIWQIRKDFSQKFEADEHGMQRVVIKLSRPAEHIIKERVLGVDVAFQQGAGQRVFVLEMVKEPAARNFHGSDDFLDGRGLEPFFQHGLFGDIQYLCFCVGFLTHGPFSCTASPVDTNLVR